MENLGVIHKGFDQEIALQQIEPKQTPRLFTGRLPRPWRSRRIVLNLGMGPGQGMVFLINGHPYDHHLKEPGCLGDT